MISQTYPQETREAGFPNSAEKKCVIISFS